MRSKVLVPLDGSEVGDRILSFVDRLPDRRFLELILVRVLSPEAGSDVAKTAVQHLRARAEPLRQAGIPTAHLITVGDPVEEIRLLIGMLQATLVAMCTHGAGAATGVRGSVAEAILRECPVPLLLGNKRGLPVDPGSGFARILLPLDGTEISARIVPTVARLALQSKSEVLLFHVDPITTPKEEQLAILAPYRDQLTQGGVEKVTLRTAVGDEAAEILEAVDREAADLLALTSHSRTATGDRRWFGSTAETVLSKAACPILVQRVLS